MTANVLPGRTTALRQYKNPADVGSNDTTKFDQTTYTYTLLGQAKTLTDATGANVWSYAAEAIRRACGRWSPGKSRPRPASRNRRSQIPPGHWSG
ncbi:hypothetical protein [Micromonospora sp. DH14]|uniref:hypothetical protein n=1 Tax=Micromonospora sp. DH14 TaxID=3040120 RepID=UPI0024434346|nr:hypothetical protein [Micromonospora sp. DH14]MDG9678949.1 hypothetical protein [Micromonospora sp. DH14]